MHLLLTCHNVKEMALTRDSMVLLAVFHPLSSIQHQKDDVLSQGSIVRDHVALCIPMLLHSAEIEKKTSCE